MLLEFAESGCPIFRVTTPLSRGKLKSKGHGKLSIHFAADQETIETIFRIIASAIHLSLYGAVANMCEEYESLHDRSGQPDKVMGQSIVLSEIKTEVPLENDDPEYQNFLLQRYEERIERLSQTDKVSKFCMDAGFLSVVEIGQYFMTKDNGEQFYAVACRESVHWNRLYSWERITQTLGIPSRIRKISHWNKCSTYLQDWCLNRMRSQE